MRKIIGKRTLSLLLSAAHIHTPDCYKINCSHENRVHDKECG